MGNQIVTCNGMDCSVCSVLSTVNNVFRYLLDISAVLAVLLVVIAGILYILGRGNEEKLEQAKRFLVFAVFGFALALLSFVIVLSTFVFSGAQNAGGWYRVDCGMGDDVNLELQAPVNPAETSYLENKDDWVVTSGNINSIVTGDKRIVKLDPSQMNPATIASDIQLMSPERRLNFIAGDSDLSYQDIIDFRNIDSGFNKDKADNYQTFEQDFFADKLADPEKKIRPILSISTTDVEDYYTVEWGKDLDKFLGGYTSPDKEGIGKITDSLEKIALVSELGGKNIYAFTSGTPSLIGSKYENCEGSGGRMKEFQNSCIADKEQYVNKDLQCSKIHNPVTSCDCPIGHYLEGEKCFSADDIKKQKKTTRDDGDRAGVKKQTCQDVSLEQNKCPSSPRCEGDKMMYYPEYAVDQCLNTLDGPQITKRSCVGTPSEKEAENKKCAEELDRKSQEEKMKEAEDYINKYGKSPDWYEKILEDAFIKDADAAIKERNRSSGAGTKDTGTGRTDSSGRPPDNGGPTDTGKIPDNGGKTDTGGKTSDTGDTGKIPQDQGAGNFNPTPSFQELKECIGLKGDQIPYNGILVVLLHPRNFDRSDRLLVNNDYENISRMFYLSRNGEVIGKNGVDLGRNPVLGGQEYGARDFKKGASHDSMWGRGWKIFKGPTNYVSYRSGWIDPYSFGTQPYKSKGGYKIGSYTRNDQGNLGGGPVFSLSDTGQHKGKKGSSAGCATLGDDSRQGFIEKAKSYMTNSDGTVMQIHIKGEMDTVSGKFKSPDCGGINFCGAKKSFQNSDARKFRNDPNEGYEAGDKRRVDC